MPYNRPGNIEYVTNDSGGTINHGDPAKIGNLVGVAVKQKAVSWTLGLDAQAQIADGEQFALIVKGIVEVPDEAGFAKGDPIYIADASVTSGVTTFDLNETNTNDKFGVVVEVVGDGRGVPTGRVRIDLDKKDSF